MKFSIQFCNLQNMNENMQYHPALTKIRGQMFVYIFDRNLRAALIFPTKEKSALET